MRLLKLALPILLAIPAHAWDRDYDLYHWDTTNTVMEGIFIVEVAMDVSQSRQIEKYAPMIREANPLLSRYPSSSAILNYSLLGVAVHAGIAYLLPDLWRTRFQAVSIVVEGLNVNSNLEVGVKLNF